MSGIPAQVLPAPGGAGSPAASGGARQRGPAIPAGSTMWPGITEGIWDARCLCTTALLRGVYQVKRLNEACPVHRHQVPSAERAEKAALPASAASYDDGGGDPRETGDAPDEQDHGGPHPAEGSSGASPQPDPGGAAPEGDAPSLEYCSDCEYPVDSPGHKFICG